jgi:hypothetical protein
LQRYGDTIDSIEIAPETFMLISRQRPHALQPSPREYGHR